MMIAEMFLCCMILLAVSFVAVSFAHSIMVMDDCKTVYYIIGHRYGKTRSLYYIGWHPVGYYYLYQKNGFRQMKVRGSTGRVMKYKTLQKCIEIQNKLNECKS